MADRKVITVSNTMFGRSGNPMVPLVTHWDLFLTVTGDCSCLVIIIIIILLSSGLDYGRFRTNRSTDLHSDFSFEYLDQMRIADRILGDLGS